MKKVLKWGLIILSSVVGLFIIGIIVLGVLAMNYYSDEGVSGEVVVLHEGDIHVGDSIPMAFVVPEEYDDLHKEMWDCYLDEGGEQQGRYEYILENVDIEKIYTEAQVEDLFKSADVNLYDSEHGDWKYTTRIAIFKPEEPGDYSIGIFGYYRSTSPQGYGGINVKVYE